MPFAFTPGVYTSTRRVTPRAAACQLSPRAERDALVQSLILRAATRAAAIAADAAAKEAAWAAELATLRTPSVAEAAAVASAAAAKDAMAAKIAADAPGHIKGGELAVIQKSFFDRFATYTEFAEQDPFSQVVEEVEEKKKKVSTFEETVKTMGERIKEVVAPSSGSAKASSKSAKASSESAKASTVETDVVETVKPGEFAPQKPAKPAEAATVETVKPSGFAPQKPAKPAEAATVETVKPGGVAPQEPAKPAEAATGSASETEEKKQRWSFGESLLDAIVEGVKPVVGEKRAEAFEDRVEGFVDRIEDVVEDVVEKVEDVVEDVVDVVEDVVEDVVDAVTGADEDAAAAAKIVPSPEIIELVSSGKVKNLTVTKLRRLLSENNMRTTGRKSELIARLTSFANSQ